MRTKFRKTFSTWFFPVGEDFIEVLADWKLELESVHGFGLEDPLFPRTIVSFGSDGSVLPARIGQAGWSNADPIRRLFKETCRAAGLPDFKPHSFRHTLGRMGQFLCSTPAELKAWSQNLGHEEVLTTLTAYGTLPDYIQKDLMADIRRRVLPARSPDGTTSA